MNYALIAIVISALALISQLIKTAWGRSFSEGERAREIVADQLENTRNKDTITKACEEIKAIKVTIGNHGTAITLHDSANAMQDGINKQFRELEGRFNRLEGQLQGKGVI